MSEQVAMSEQVPIAIGVDVGGSGIKGAAVDVATGRLASDRHRILTPQPATPQACLEVIARIVKSIERDVPAAKAAPIAVDVPSVVIGGVTKTAANIDPGWVGFDAAQGLARVIGRPVQVLNDADAAGLAEMRFGAGRGHRGTVIVLTLGTGVGSGVFVDGMLIPNTELGHMEIRGRDAERRSAAAARVRRGLSWKAWAEDLDEHLNAIHKLFWPSLFILGGGVSKNGDKFIPRLTVPTRVVAATLRNEAGIVGAALYAAEAAHEQAIAIPMAAPEPGSEAAEDEAASSERAEPGAPGQAEDGGAAVGADEAEIEREGAVADWEAEGGSTADASGGTEGATEGTEAGEHPAGEHPAVEPEAADPEAVEPEAVEPEATEPEAAVAQSWNGAEPPAEPDRVEPAPAAADPGISEPAGQDPRPAAG